MKFRFYLSLLVAKVLHSFLKITKLSSGTAILGLISLKICPDFLKFANNKFTDKKINITGTNGKTTTSGLITHLIRQDHKTVLNNSEGANMLNGIINSLAIQINPLKKFNYSVIETDEAFLQKVYATFNGDYLLVTNLFEDQTDRFNTPEVTKNLIQNGIDLQNNLSLILNADEPLSASLKAKNTSAIYYGVTKVIDSDGNTQENNEYTNYKCPVCGNYLNYEKQFYAHIGHYSCTCGFKRAEVKYEAEIFLNKDFSVIKLGNEEYKIPLLGLYNAYNALGAIALAKELNIQNIQNNIESFRVAFGRNEKRVLKGHNTVIQLIKNPAGTNEVLKTVDLDSNILIAINNNIADGTDISWINATNFELLKNAKKEIVVSGLKASDMATRLKNAGIKDLKIINNIEKAVDYVGAKTDNNITILTTYTALLKIDKIKELKKCY